MPLIDLHCDTLTECLYRSGSFSENGLQIDLDKLRRADALVQCFAVFIPTHEEAAEKGVTEGPYPFYKRALAYYKKQLSENADLMAPALKYSDIEANRKAEKITSLLTVEDAGAAIEGKLERVEELYADGVRLLTFTWNYENCLGYPNSEDPAVMGKGLKPFGVETLERAEALGMIADVSHLSEGGFWDTVRFAKKPFVASHSSCRALCAHPRNLSDAMLRALADKGGAAGVNFYDRFLVKGGFSPVTPERVVDHLEHMVSVAGEDTPAFGSDYDGITGSVLSWRDVSGTPEIVKAMEKRGFTPRLIDKICYQNALRVLKDTLG